MRTSNIQYFKPAGYFKPVGREEREIDPYVASILGGFVLMSVVVWLLAIGKLIDLIAWF